MASEFVALSALQDRDGTCSPRPDRDIGESRGSSTRPEGLTTIRASERQALPTPRGHVDRRQSGVALTTDHPCRLVIATPTSLHAAARSGDPGPAGT